MSHPLTRVPGFQAAGVTCGLKASGNKDMALIASELSCVWAATFTANTFCAAPVLYDKALLEQSGGRGLRAVLINAGIANAVTGARGLQDAEAMARRLEAEAGLPEGSAAVMSTGVIGHLLPMEKIELGIIQAAAALAPEGGADAAEAIMTTDTVPKAAFVQIEAGGRQISIGGIAKGSGMIHPNMATMLATLVTDAPVAPVDLDAALHTAVNRSFNRISVDGDTSTNDTVIVMASGSAGGDELRGEDLAQFTAALTEVCVDLAKQIARDGEGATKLIEIEIKGAKSEEEAVKAAATLATSLLSKTAIFGGDPNWGRFLAAIGRSGAAVDPTAAALWLTAGEGAPTQLLKEGRPLPFDASILSAAIRANSQVNITVDLGVGSASARYWTCDLSYDYVKINAEYHT